MSTKEDFDLIIDKLLDEGIEIMLSRREGKTIYDLNSGAKSHLWLHYDPVDQLIRYEGRYDNGHVDGYLDLLFVMTDCYRIGGFASFAWIDLLIKEGSLTKKVETKVSYS